MFHKEPHCRFDKFDLWKFHKRSFQRLKTEMDKYGIAPDKSILTLRGVNCFFNSFLCILQVGTIRISSQIFSLDAELKERRHLVSEWCLHHFFKSYLDVVCLWQILLDITIKRRPNGILCRKQPEQIPHPVTLSWHQANHSYPPNAERQASSF